MQSLPHRTRLLIALAIILTLGFLTTAVGNYIVSRDKVRESILAQELPLTGDNIYSELQKDLLRPVFISSLMARDTFLRDWVIAGEHDTAPLVRYLSEIKAQYGTITSFFVSDQTRRYYYPGGQLKNVDEKDSRDRWYFRVQQMSQPYETNVDPDLANRDTMTVFINYRVLDYKGKFIGVTGVGLTLEKMARLIDRYQQRFQRHIFFVSPKGEVMLRATQDAALSNSIHDMPGLKDIAGPILTAGKEPLSSHYEFNGSNTHVNSRFIPELGWFLVVEQDERESLASLRQMAYFNFGISLVVTLLVLGVTWYVIRYYQRRLELMATTDKLTGLFNRQALDALLEQVHKDVQREPYPLSVLLLDIDYFKSVNDRYGHVAGDAVIVAVSNLIKTKLRKNDIVVRWGGEEFLVLLRECSLLEAGHLGEQIRTALQDVETEWQGQGIKVTASLGVAQFEAGESIDDFFGRADGALYRAKDAGRNRLEVGLP